METPPTIPDEQARHLAEELARLVQTGGDDQHLRDRVSNVLRVKGEVAVTVVADFRSGYHAGASAPLDPDQAPPMPEGASTLWREAYWAARYHTAQLAARIQRERKQDSKRKLTSQWIVLGVLLAVLIGLIGLVAWV